MSFSKLASSDQWISFFIVVTKANSSAAEFEDAPNILFSSRNFSGRGAAV